MMAPVGKERVFDPESADGDEDGNVEGPVHTAANYDMWIVSMGYVW